MTTKEADVLTVAAELVRAKWEDDVPAHLADRMASWALRLRAAHDELLASLTVTDETMLCVGCGTSTEHHNPFCPLEEGVSFDA